MVVFQLVSCQLAQLSMNIGELQGFLQKHECWATNGCFHRHGCPSLPQQPSGSWWVLCKCFLTYRTKPMFTFIYCNSYCHTKDSPLRPAQHSLPTLISAFLQQLTEGKHIKHRQSAFCWRHLLLLAASVLWDFLSQDCSFMVNNPYSISFFMWFCNWFWSHLFFWQLEYPMTMNFSLLCEIFVFIMLPQIV